MTTDLKFKYDGSWRRVSNVTFEDISLIGFEMRKSGQFSYKVKRYSLDKISDMTYIKPILRSGPKVAIPS